MSLEQSILDKVLENKQAEELHQFNPDMLIAALFEHLNEREREVLTRRFGLLGEDPETLEVIGKHFGVTRERVRQIETGSIKKLRNHKDSAEMLKPVESILYQLLDSHGGILEENHLLDLALGDRAERLVARAILLFLLEKLLADHFDLLHNADRYHRSWKLASVEEAHVNDLLDKLMGAVTDHSEPIDEQELVEKILAQLNGSVDENRVRGHLRICRGLKRNIFGHWGCADWNTISPKRMNDKIHLVLKHVKKPLHFTEIAEKINELKFDHKTAYPATVHNELILDEKYVLVGRGIYALSEWGYEPGVVADVIERVLRDAQMPMSREEIVKAVLEQRIVGKSTVHLALMNKDRFSKTEEGKYQVA